MRVKQGRREGRGEGHRGRRAEGEGSGQGGEGEMGRGQRTGRGKGGDEDGLARHASRQAMHGCPPRFSSAHAPSCPLASRQPMHRLVSVSCSCVLFQSLGCVGRTSLTRRKKGSVCVLVRTSSIDGRIPKRRRIMRVSPIGLVRLRIRFASALPSPYFRVSSWSTTLSVYSEVRKTLSAPDTELTKLEARGRNRGAGLVDGAMSALDGAIRGGSRCKRARSTQQTSTRPMSRSARS